jgi:hypothetical protein
VLHQRNGIEVTQITFMRDYFEEGWDSRIAGAHALAGRLARNQLERKGHYGNRDFTGARLRSRVRPRKRRLTLLAGHSMPYGHRSRPL